MAGTTLLDIIRDMEKRLHKLEAQGTTELRTGEVDAFDSTAYTATITVSGASMGEVNVLWSIRSDLMTDGASCLVLFAGAVTAEDALVVGLYGGQPAPDPIMDPIMGHRHTGLAADGPQLSYNDLVNTP